MKFITIMCSQFGLAAASVQSALARHDVTAGIELETGERTEEHCETNSSLNQFSQGDKIQFSVIDKRLQVILPCEQKDVQKQKVLTVCDCDKSGGCPFTLSGNWLLERCVQPEFVYIIFF